MSRGPNVVTTVGPPPDAETRQIPLAARPELKKMVLSGPQSKPRLSAMSHNVCGDPPASATFFTFWSATKASHSPSGENTGLSAPSVPGIGLAANSSSPRTYSCRRLSRPATYTRRRPSGEIATIPSAVTGKGSAGMTISRATEADVDAVDGRGVKRQTTSPDTTA